MAESGCIATLLALALAGPPAAPAPTAPAQPAPKDMSLKPGPIVEAAARPAPGVEGPAPAPAAPAPVQGACNGSRPCKRLVLLGSVTGALGLATIVTGVALATRPIRVDADDPTMAITYRPAGTAVLTIGIGVLATSVLMALAATRASRQARRMGSVARWSAPREHAMLTP